MTKLHTLTFRGINNSDLISISEIEYKEKGLFISENDSWESANNKVYTNNSILKEIDEALLKDAKIYRYPNISFPRTKADILKNKYNIKIIRNIDEADYSIISQQYLDSIVDYNYCKFTDKKTIENYISKYYNSFTSNAINHIRTIIQTISDDDKIEITASSYYGNSQNKFLKNINTSFDSKFIYFVLDENLNHYNNIINAKNLIFDTFFNNIANSDSHILTELEYENLERMIKTGDNENLTLALEIMANCNIEESYDIIALLLYFNIDVLRASKSWNLINIKSMRNLMKPFIVSGTKSYAHAYDYFIDNLASKNQLTEFAFKITVQLLFTNVINRTLGFDDETNPCVFKIDVSSVQLIDKYKNKLKLKI